MISLHQKLQELNQVSESILFELDGENPSLDSIQLSLDTRNDIIGEIRDYIHSSHISDLCENEKKALKPYFNDFRQLNKEIQAKLTDSLNRNQQELVTAAKQRKAEDRYHVLKKPDISYF